MNISIEKTERQKLAQQVLKSAGLLCYEVPELLVDWILYTSPYNDKELYFLPILEKLKGNPDFVVNQKVEAFVNISKDLPTITEYSLPIWWGTFWEYTMYQKWISGIVVTKENIIIFSKESSCPIYLRETGAPCGAGGAYDETPDKGKITVFKRKDFSKIKTQGMSFAKSDKSIEDFMFKMIKKNNSSSVKILDVLKLFIKQFNFMINGYKKSIFREVINYKNQEEFNFDFQKYINEKGIFLSEEEKKLGILSNMMHFNNSKKSTYYWKVLKECQSGEILRIDNLGYVDRTEWEEIKLTK